MGVGDGRNCDLGELEDFVEYSYVVEVVVAHTAIRWQECRDPRRA